MKADRRRQFDEINVTPLTDIFLVLLIIMMVVTPMLDIKGLDLTVTPIGPADDSKEKPKTLILSIGPEDDFSIGEQAVSKSDLVSTIREQAPANPEGVIIEIDAAATHEALTYALASVQLAGITRVGVSERKRETKNELAPPTPAGKPKDTSKK